MPETDIMIVLDLGDPVPFFTLISSQLATCTTLRFHRVWRNPVQKYHCCIWGGFEEATKCHMLLILKYQTSNTFSSVSCISQTYFVRKSRSRVLTKAITESSRYHWLCVSLTCDDLLHVDIHNYVNNILNDEASSYWWALACRHIIASEHLKQFGLNDLRLQRIPLITTCRLH